MGNLVASSGQIDRNVTTERRREGGEEEREEADLQCGQLPPVKGEGEEGGGREREVVGGGR